MKRIRIWWLRWRLADLDVDIEFQRNAMAGLDVSLRASLVARRRLVSELAMLDCPAAALRSVLGR